MPSTNPETPRKPVQSQSKSANRAPSLVLPSLRRMIVDAVRAGRSVAQTAKEYQVSQACVLELVVRAELARIFARLERVEDAVLQPPPRLIARAA